MSYAESVLKGYYKIRGSGATGASPRASRRTPAQRIINPLRKYIPKSLPKRFHPANNPRPVIRPANLPGRPALPRKAIQRLLRQMARRHPLGMAALLFFTYGKTSPEFPGLENVAAAWRKPVVTEVPPGGYAPNSFDHHGTHGNTGDESLLDTDDIVFPTIKYWGDYWMNPVPEGAPIPFIPSPPLRYDEESPLTQKGAHPATHPLPRYTATVVGRKDYVTRPETPGTPENMPAEVLLLPLVQSLVLAGAVSQKRQPHTRNRPRRNDPGRSEIKMSSRFARAMTTVFDVAEIVELFARIIKILLQPDWFVINTPQRKVYILNKKTQRIMTLLIAHVVEDIVVRAIRPGISVRNPNILLQHL